MYLKSCTPNLLYTPYFVDIIFYPKNHPNQKQEQRIPSTEEFMYKTPHYNTSD